MSASKSFGDYELLDEIARGGMGVVFKARQRNLGRIVAVKMILAGSLAGKEFVQRFRTESAAAAILQHPNIVAIHDVGVHDGRHYFSMDFIRGEPIHARPITAPQKLWRWGRRKPLLALLIVLLHVVGAAGLAGIVWQWRRAEHHLYVANMNVAQHRWEQNHVSRVRELLEATANSSERGFEWYYWQRQLHLELMALRGHTGPIESCPATGLNRLVMRVPSAGHRTR